MVKLVGHIVKSVILVAIIASVIVMVALLGKEVPATQAFLVVDIATLGAFAYAYYSTKDKFWLIMLASTVPMLISDLYFYQSFSLIFPRTNAAGASGTGMNMWAGTHLAITSVGCFLYFKKTVFSFINLAALFAAALTNISFGSGLLSRGSIGEVMGLVLQAVVIGYLVYYGVKTKRILFCVGAILWFLSVFAIVVYFFNVSRAITPFTLGISDKTITIGRALTGIGALENSRSFNLNRQQTATHD